MRDSERREEHDGEGSPQEPSPTLRPAICMKRGHEVGLRDDAIRTEHEDVDGEEAGTDDSGGEEHDDGGTRVRKRVGLRLKRRRHPSSYNPDKRRGATRRTARHGDDTFAKSRARSPCGTRCCHAPCACAIANIGRDAMFSRPVFANSPRTSLTLSAARAPADVGLTPHMRAPWVRLGTRMCQAGCPHVLPPEVP